MTDDNKRNLVYFESTSMRGLYKGYERVAGRTPQACCSPSRSKQDGGLFCCIALDEPERGRHRVRERHGSGLRERRLCERDAGQLTTTAAVL